MAQASPGRTPARVRGAGEMSGVRRRALARARSRSVPPASCDGGGQHGARASRLSCAAAGFHIRRDRQADGQPSGRGESGRSAAPPACGCETSPRASQPAPPEAIAAVQVRAAGRHRTMSGAQRSTRTIAPPPQALRLHLSASASRLASPRSRKGTLRRTTTACAQHRRLAHAMPAATLRPPACRAQRVQIRRVVDAPTLRLAEIVDRVGRLQAVGRARPMFARPAGAQDALRFGGNAARSPLRGASRRPGSQRDDAAAQCARRAQRRPPRLIASRLRRRRSSAALLRRIDGEATRREGRGDQSIAWSAAYVVHNNLPSTRSRPHGGIMENISQLFQGAG